MFHSGGAPQKLKMDGRPLWPRPVHDWKSYLLDANRLQVQEFASYAQIKHGEGRKALSKDEVLGEFCLGLAGDCNKELEARLGGRSAESRLEAYAGALWQLSKDFDLERVRGNSGTEWIRLKDQGRPKGEFTHRLYINPQMGRLAQLVSLLQEVQSSIKDDQTLRNVFRFKFISPLSLVDSGFESVHAMMPPIPLLVKTGSEYVRVEDGFPKDGKISPDCLNFIRPDRIIVTFHESEFVQIADIIRSMDIEVRATCGDDRNFLLREEMPAFTIPYVYNSNGQTSVFSFGLHNSRIRYGELVAAALSRAYSQMSEKGDFSPNCAREAIRSNLPDSIGEPILELLHRLYTEDCARAAVQYMQTRRALRE